VRRRSLGRAPFLLSAAPLFAPISGFGSLRLIQNNLVSLQHFTHGASSSRCVSLLSVLMCLAVCG
jgi:hypothetical protein